MKSRKYIQGITIFTTSEMYQQVKQASDELEISLSEFFRTVIREYFENQDNPEGKSLQQESTIIEHRVNEPK